ncbi:stage IV sporulation protein A [Lachnospiraceae bacterium NSJ-143]|nr:stage IV sporulation protein A [Lachnospiraceae bacterium NSJ-143]
MSVYDIYDDIARRTDNNIYIGVIGAVRTGKSTFIKRFMDSLVLPNIQDEYTKERAKDELPQSASGKTIMTTEPKFIPNEPVKINMGDNVSLNVRLIDCVGYVIPGAEGHMNGEEPRMVNTPWSSSPMPFEKAAEMGTQKVIKDHSTIGIVVTTDGSITDIGRDSYVSAENRVINELKELGKPFIVLLNSVHPYSQETEELRENLENEHGVSVLSVNCAQLKQDDITDIIEKILMEFPIKEVRLDFPKWLDTLSFEHDIKKDVVNAIKGFMENADKIKDITPNAKGLEQSDYIRSAYIRNIDMGTGSADIDIALNDGLFYNVISETAGSEIKDDYELVSLLKELSDMKKSYAKIESALSEAQNKGYGIVFPQMDDIKLMEPQIYKQGSQYGVKLKAKGSSIHLIRADIDSEVSPVIGSEEQTKEYISKLKDDMKHDPENIWQLNIFGRTLDSLLTEGINGKLYAMPQDAQNKLQETMEKIINEGNGGLICILL